MTTDHIGPGTGVAHDFYYYPGDGFGFGYGFAVRVDPGLAIPSPPGSPGKWDGATGAYIVVDRAEDMFFRRDAGFAVRPSACQQDDQGDHL